MARRKRPYDPAARERALAERREADEIAARAEKSGAEALRDKSGRVTLIRRATPLTRLLRAEAITKDQHDAAISLAELWAVWKGLDGRDGSGEPVDGSGGCVELVTDRMLKAGRGVARLLAYLGPAGRAVVRELMTAIVEEDRQREWREVVEAVWPGLSRDQQSMVIAMALEDLRRTMADGPRRNAA